MATFTYTARSRTGEKIAGQLEAGDRRGALLQIERLGHIPVAVEEKAAADTRPKESKRWRLVLRRNRAQRMSMREALLFTTEMGDLLASGMKLGNALNTLAQRRTHKDSDQIIAALRDDIIHGTSLSDALSKHKTSFSTFYVSLIRAGEASGALPEVMQRLVKHYEQVQEVRDKVVTAMVYPCFVLVAGVATMIFAMVFVIPRFAKIFEDIGHALPLPTRILIGLSNFMVNFGWLLLIGIVIFVVLFRRFLATSQGKLWWNKAQLKLPYLRDVVMASAFAQFARTLGLLIGNGVHVLNALGIVERTIQNEIIAREIRNAREQVTDGATISVPLAASKVFPPLLTDMLAIGEETGDMAGALNHIAHRYENELDHRIRILTIILEPLLIVLMAGLVGFVAISILLAVFDLSSGLNV